MPCLHFSFECETRKIKCNADERCRRQLDGGEPLPAHSADANESRHSGKKLYVGYFSRERISFCTFLLKLFRTAS